MNVYLKMLGENDDNIKLFALEKISASKMNEHTAAVLFSYINTVSPLVKVKIVTMLNDFKYIKMNEYSRKEIDSEKDPFVKATLVKSLGITGNTDNIPLIVKYLIDDNPRIRANAVEAVKCCGSRTVMELLIPMKDDVNHRVKMNIYLALYEAAGEDFFGDIVSFSKSDNYLLRASCAHALSKIHTKRVFPVLVSLLRDEEAVVRKNAVKAIGKEKNITYVKHFVEAFCRESDENVRNEIITAMLLTDVEKSVELLYRAVSELDNVEIKTNFIKALGVLKSDMGMSILTKYLKDGSDKIRCCAIDSLGAYGNKSIVEVLLPFLNDPSEDVQINAAKILWKFGIMNAYTSLKKMVLPDKNESIRKKARCVLALMGM
ncbi:MAG: HEAT repeat domain-containing protein [Candidatus Muiribacteriota bacterium]